MTSQLFELVVEGPYAVIKGFCAGLLSGLPGEHTVFYSRDRGIGRATLLDRLKIWAHLGENMSHLVVDLPLKEKLERAIKASAKELDLELMSAKPISSAQFKFRYAAYSRNVARQLKEILDDPPRGVTVRNYRTKEKVIASAKGPEGYAPLHDFELHGEGEVAGALPGVVTFRERLTTHAMVQVDEIELLFGDIVARNRVEAEKTPTTANRPPSPQRGSHRGHPRRRSSGGGSYR